MFNREIDAVLKVIALSIFADKRVLSSEITAFVESAELIQENVNSDIVITEAKLLLWFELNRADLREKISLKVTEFEKWFVSLLEDLPVLPNKRFMTEAVERISNSDGEFHISEKALEVILNRVFNLPNYAA